MMESLAELYIRASVAYYQHDDPIMSDAGYDNLCKRLLKDYEDLPEVMKVMIDKGELECGSGFGVPARVRGGAE